MSVVDWLRRYVFRGIGLIILAGAVTILVLWFSSCGRMTFAEYRHQKEEAKRALEAQHAGADDAIRRYQQSQIQAPQARKPAAAKEVSR